MNSKQTSTEVEGASADRPPQSEQVSHTLSYRWMPVVLWRARRDSVLCQNTLYFTIQKSQKLNWLEAEVNAIKVRTVRVEIRRCGYFDDRFSDHFRRRKNWSISIAN